MMASTIKPSRALRLSVVFAITLFISIGLTLLASPADAGAARDNYDNYDVGKSYTSRYEGCTKRFNPNRARTFACIRVTGPRVVLEGKRYTLTLRFTPRVTMRKVRTAFIGFDNKVHPRTYKVIKKGHTVVRKMTLTAGSAGGEGGIVAARTPSSINWNVDHNILVMTPEQAKARGH